MIDRAIIDPEHVLVIRKTEPMFFLKYQGKFGSSRNLLLRAAAYDTVRHRTVLPLQQVTETDMVIRTRRMVIITKRINLDSSTGIYLTASVEDGCHMIAQNQNTQEEEKKRASKLNDFKNLLTLPSVGYTLQNSL